LPRKTQLNQYSYHILASAKAVFLQRADLGQDVDLVDGNVLREIADLGGDDEGEQRDRCKGAGEAGDDRSQAGNAEAFEPSNDWGDGEGQEQKVRSTATAIGRNTSRPK
jgi:hypothetical protein